MSKVWRITGSGSGLGRAIAEAGLEAGDRVVATARNTDQLTDLVAQYGARVLAFQLDVTIEAQGIGPNPGFRDRRASRNHRALDLSNCRGNFGMPERSAALHAAR